MIQSRNIEEIFFNEYLPNEGGLLFSQISSDLEMVTAHFSTWMEQNHPESWHPKFDKTIYKEAAEKFLSDPRTKKIKVA
jgi:hypothetical protein